MKTRKSACPGFTLVEILVVITIIGMLLALLMPAVSRARESGRRTQCTNNLHQLSVACAAYESANRRFPGSVTTISATGVQGYATKGGWGVMLLPFVERNDLWKQIQSGATNSTTQAPVFQQALPVYVCPSDPPDTLIGAVGPSAYISNLLIFRDGRLGAALPPRSQAFVSMNDGTATTLLLSENIRSDPNHTNWVHNWWDIYNGSDFFKDNGVSNWTTFTWEPTTVSATPMQDFLKSKHGAGVMTAFCDGNVRFLRDDIDCYNILVTPDGTTNATAPYFPEKTISEGDF